MVADDSVARVRDSVARTLPDGGALIRYEPRVMTIDPADVERRLRERGNRLASLIGKAVNAADVSPARGLDGPDGRIDFAARRSTYFAGCWKVFADAWMYDGEPGEWEAEPRTVLVEDDPLWLLALTQATIQAVKESADVIAGVVCERYRCVADLELKPTVDGLTVQAPNWGAGSEPSRLPIVVWLDDEGRIRRASYNGGNNLTELELRDFGPRTRSRSPAPTRFTGYTRSTSRRWGPQKPVVTRSRYRTATEPLPGQAEAASALATPVAAAARLRGSANAGVLVRAGVAVLRTGRPVRKLAIASVAENPTGGRGP